MFSYPFVIYIYRDLLLHVRVHDIPAGKDGGYLTVTNITSIKLDILQIDSGIEKCSLYNLTEYGHHRIYTIQIM